MAYIPFNTNNPLPSASLQDLSDNAVNTDIAANNRTSRTWTDRLGNVRKTLWGMEQDFNDFIAASGFVNLGNYTAGLVLNNFNTTFTKDGIAYRAAPTTVLPYTTTGVWASESSKFVIAGDSSLRQDLAVFSGAGLIGFRRAPTLPAFTLEQTLKVSGTVNVVSAGAVGDGVADDTAALALAEITAFNTGAQLLFPAGFIFTSTAPLTLRVPLLGAGAVLKATNSTPRTDRWTGALIQQMSPNAAIIGLRLECGHKCAGISAKNLAAAQVREAQIIEPILGGVSFELVGQAVASGLFIQDARAIATDLDSGDGVFALNCSNFSATDIACAGFQQGGVYAKQTIPGSFTANITKILATGGNWTFVDPAALGVFGVGVDSYFSTLVDGVVVSSFLTGGSFAGIAAGVVINNKAVGYSPVVSMTKVQVHAGTNPDQFKAGIAVFGLYNTLELQLKTVDINGLNIGIALFGGFRNVYLEDIVGRNMAYTDLNMSLIQCTAFTTPTSNATVSLSNISDISPLRGGSGQEATTILMNYPNTSTLLTNCPGVISFCSILSTSSTLIANCNNLNHRKTTVPMVAGDLTISNSVISATANSSKQLFGSNSVVNLGTGTRIVAFTSMGQNQPAVLNATGVYSHNSPVPIASGETNITSTKHIHTISGSPITFGTSFAGGYRTTISAVNIDMADPSANPIGRLGANSPSSYIINAVHWSGGLPDVTNFNPAHGDASGNRKAS